MDVTKQPSSRLEDALLVVQPARCETTLPRPIPERKARSPGRRAIASASFHDPAAAGVAVSGCDILVKARRMAALRLTPQKREFFVLFAQASANACEIARMLVELVENWPASRAVLDDIHEAEHEGDRLTREVINLLNRTFVTPFDRDDMYRLATVLDDIVDHVDEAADDIDAYEVQEVPEAARRQADVIYRAAARLHEAVELLERFGDTNRHLFALRELEDEGDRLVREAIADLFRSDRDPLFIIRWKDIHEQLEEAVDACENAADVLEAILVKNR